AQPDGCNGLDGFTQLALARAAMPPAGPGRAQLAPHLGRLLVERTLHSAGTTARAAIDSTLDAGVQRLAMASLQRHLRELAGRHVEDG
ncbi:hypothetical protein O6268_23710, partial [Salmonella enterica subsp. enterica]